MKQKLDLNCDLGEGYNDSAIMPFISSCNIACGGHVGDSESIKKAALLAREHGVAIGAHPSYPDRENFGRSSMDISMKNLLDSISEQLYLVKEICEGEGLTLHHIKPHGALYNDMAKDKALSGEILNLFKKESPGTLIYALSESCAIEVAKELKLSTCSEVFADRKYENKSCLRSRQMDGAVLTTTSDIICQIDGFLRGTITDYHQQTSKLKVDSICLHSDTENAIYHAQTINQYLKSKDVLIAAHS